MSGFFGSPLITETVKDGNSHREVRLFTDFRYYSDVLGRWVVVPKGFETDFATLYRLPLVMLLLSGVGDRAAVVHDYLIRAKEVPRYVADAVFKEALTACGIAKWRRLLFYSGVRAWTAIKGD